VSLVKYNNNSISAVTSAASIPSGALVPIKTLTASSSATLSFVHGTDGVVFDSTYPIYMFKFINCHPATDNTPFKFQGSTDGGSNYNTTLTSTTFRAYHYENGSAAALEYRTGDDQAQGTAFQQITNNVGNANDESLAGTLFLYNPSSTTFVKHFMCNTNEYNATVVSLNYFTAGYFNTTSAINAVQFKFDSGNIDAGTIKLYGIKDS
jgi:hypothetical protein